MLLLLLVLTNLNIVVLLTTLLVTPLPDEMRVQLVPSRNVDALAEALCQLMNRRNDRSYLGDAACTFVEKFSWSSIARSHLEIYEKIGSV